MGSYIVSDFRCNECSKKFEVRKQSIRDDFPKSPKCPHCGETNTYRIYAPLTYEVAEGRAGNAKNGYSQGFVDHPSNIIGKVKGETIK